jgi:segregation and condensation protein A
MNFRVDLDIFRGPLDLLLYLVRKHEVEIAELPIAPITEQFLEYLELLEQLDVNAVGDFLEMASTLVEIKSRMVLPRAGEIEEELEDPRQELVLRLLQYKKYRDAASMLDERSRRWQEHFPRVASDLPTRKRNLADEPIHEVELWDLVSAFGRVMREKVASRASNIVYDDTPIHVYMRRIHARLTREGRIAFSEIFQPGMHKSSYIGIFLAILELVRHHGVWAEQNELFGEIWVLPGESAAKELNLAGAETYEHPASEEE